MNKIETSRRMAFARAACHAEQRPGFERAPERVWAPWEKEWLDDCARFGCSTMVRACVHLASRGIEEK